MDSERLPIWLTVLWESLRHPWKTPTDWQSTASKSLNSAKHPLQVIQALRRDHLGAFIEIEHFHRDATVITLFFQRSGNRPEIHVAEAVAFHILVVRVEVGKVRRRVADVLGNAIWFSARGLPD